MWKAGRAVAWSQISGGGAEGILNGWVDLWVMWVVVRIERRRVSVKVARRAIVVSGFDLAGGVGLSKPSLVGESVSDRRRRSLSL